LIEHVVRSTIDVVSFAMSRDSPACFSPGFAATSNKHEAFGSFASNITRRSQPTVPVILVTLVYINRARTHLGIESETWACERVFLGALIVATKYLNDSSPKNFHWSVLTGIFGARDIGTIEREFLGVLDWDLAISEANILEHYDSVMSLYDCRRRHAPSYGRASSFCHRAERNRSVVILYVYIVTQNKSHPRMGTSPTLIFQTAVNI